MASISSTALRLAAIEALAPHALLTEPAPVWPTLAQGRVIDSGSTPIDRTDPTAGAAIISVYSDEAKGHPRGEAYGLDPQDLVIDLIFDIEIVTIEDGMLVVGQTDADAAAKLDLMAAQIRRVLTRGATAEAFRRLAKAFGPIDARGTRHPEMQAPLARLTLRIPVHVDDDDWDDVTEGLPSPASLIRPLLPVGSYGATLLAALADLHVAPDDPTPLEIIHFGFGDPVPETVETAPVHGTIVTS